MNFRSIIRFSTAAALMLTMALPAMGDTNIAVRQAEGSDVVQVFPLDDSVCLTFDSTGNMSVSGDNGQNSKIKLADGMCITFDDAAGAAGIAADITGPSMLYSRADQTVAFTGIETGTVITVHDTKGVLVLRAEYTSGGCISLASTAPGIYIVKAEKYSFKLVK